MQRQWILDAVKNSLEESKESIRELEDLEIMEGGEILVLLDQIRNTVVAKTYNLKDCG